MIWGKGSSWFMLGCIRAIPPPSLQVSHLPSCCSLPLHLWYCNLLLLCFLSGNRRHCLPAVRATRVSIFLQWCFHACTCCLLSWQRDLPSDCSLLITTACLCLRVCQLGCCPLLLSLCIHPLLALCLSYCVCVNVCDTLLMLMASTGILLPSCVHLALMRLLMPMPYKTCLVKRCTDAVADVASGKSFMELKTEPAVVDTDGLTKQASSKGGQGGLREAVSPTRDCMAQALR